MYPGFSNSSSTDIFIRRSNESNKTAVMKELTVEFLFNPLLPENILLSNFEI